MISFSSPPLLEVHDSLVGDDDVQQSPLLAGLGFQNQGYTGLTSSGYKKRSYSMSSDDDPWDESSSVKVGNASPSQAILYIQV